MGKFDFLDKLGESKSNFTTIPTTKSEVEKINLLEILKTRNLIGIEFKDELISLLVNKKIDEEVLNNNINKSISIFEEIQVKILSIDEEMFKQKNDELEYIGAMDRMPNDKREIYPDIGKISYQFIKEIYGNLKNKVLTIKEIVALSDAFGFNLLNVFNVEQISHK